MPPSVDEWLPQRHLARFVVEVVDGLDRERDEQELSRFGFGLTSYLAVLLSLLVYGCATGVFSSRKLERATYDFVAFRFIAANDHPDHDTIATFRRRFLKEIEALFVKVLLLAREMGVLEMGTVALTTGAFQDMQQARPAGRSGRPGRLRGGHRRPGPGDTPARLRAYQSEFGADWTLLTGTPAHIAALWKHFGIYYQKVPEDRARRYRLVDAPAPHVRRRTTTNGSS